MDGVVWRTALGKFQQFAIANDVLLCAIDIIYYHFLTSPCCVLPSSPLEGEGGGSAEEKQTTGDRASEGATFKNAGKGGGVVCVSAEEQGQ